MTAKDLGETALPPHWTFKRILWWATFTAVNGTVLGLSAQCSVSFKVRSCLTASLLFCISKFLQFTHDESGYWLTPFLRWGPVSCVLDLLGLAAELLRT